MLQINLSSVDPDENLSQCVNLLHLTIVSFCKHFNLVPKQASTLLQEGNKLLGLLLIKGMKNDFDPVIQWY
jgi:hypothetical protein